MKFNKFKFKSGVEVRDRLIMAPMTTFSADEQDYVSKSGKGFYGQMGIDHDATIPRLTELADVI